MSEPTDAQLAATLRIIADDLEKDGRRTFAGEIHLAAQRLDARGEISETVIAKVAKAIGRTTTELGGGCDEPCDTHDGTCICINLHWDQARAALETARRGEG